MKIQVTQENLNHALNAVYRVASIKTQLPILSNILLRTDNNRLLIAATNLEIAVTEYIGVKIIKPGAITIPAKLISEFVTNLPKETIDLEVKNDNLHIKCGSYTSIINGYIADDFPELPTINEEASTQFNIKVNDFKQAISQTIIATSSDNTRPVLTGIYWHVFNKKLYLVATDGYRLAEKVLMSSDKPLDAIIPTQTMQEALRNITDETEEINILFDETQVRLRINNTEIISRLIDGKFPDYRQLIPKSNETNISVNKDSFLRVIKIASLFARESGGSVVLSSDKTKGLLSVHSIASQLGENTSEVAATTDSDGQITLNSRYLMEALAVIDADQISFSFNGKLAPCVVKAEAKDVDYFHIIMPLKS